EVADRRMRSPDRIQVVVDVVELWETIVQPRRGDSHLVPARGEATHRLVRVAITAQVLGQEQIAREEHPPAVAHQIEAPRSPATTLGPSTARESAPRKRGSESCAGQAASARASHVRLRARRRCRYACRAKVTYIQPRTKPARPATR